jgi:hypothetical protein
LRTPFAFFVSWWLLKRSCVVITFNRLAENESILLTKLCTADCSPFLNGDLSGFQIKVPWC